MKLLSPLQMNSAAGNYAASVDRVLASCANHAQLSLTTNPWIPAHPPIPMLDSSGNRLPEWSDEVLERMQQKQQYLNSLDTPSPQNCVDNIQKPP